MIWSKGNNIYVFTNGSTTSSLFIHLYKESAEWKLAWVPGPPSSPAKGVGKKHNARRWSKAKCPCKVETVENFVKDHIVNTMNKKSAF